MPVGGVRNAQDPILEAAMPKREDPTMEMSTSQLVPDKPRGDASVWKQTVVGTEDFLPASQPRDRTALWLVLGFVVVAAVAAALVAFVL
jgi:hypothetical protein